MPPVHRPDRNPPGQCWLPAMVGSESSLTSVTPSAVTRMVYRVPGSRLGNLSCWLHSPYRAQGMHCPRDPCIRPGIRWRRSPRPKRCPATLQTPIQPQVGRHVQRLQRAVIVGVLVVSARSYAFNESTNAIVRSYTGHAPEPFAARPSLRRQPAPQPGLATSPATLARCTFWFG